MASVLERIVVSVPACQIKDTYVTYQINISKGATSWFVRRRYQDFEKLHTVIKRALSQEVVPDLPPKKLRLGASKFAADFIESRRVGLEGYLVRLVAVVEPERIEALDDFLEYAEHCLEQAITVLGGVTELYHVVRMLKTAADRAAAVHSKLRRASATGGGAGGAEEDEEEDGDGGGRAPAAAVANPNLPGGGELLPTLREVVRMMTEYGAILRSGCEDAEEGSDATSASNAHLSSRLHAKEEETVDLRQLMAALREKRRTECDRERAALLLAAAQSRTVVAELRRVMREQSLYRSTTESHRAEAARLRGGDVASWEKGALMPAFPAGSSGGGGGGSAAAELPTQAGSLLRASAAAQRVHESLQRSAGAPSEREDGPGLVIPSLLASGGGFSAGGGDSDRNPPSSGAHAQRDTAPQRGVGSSSSSSNSLPPSVAPDGLSVLAAGGGLLSGGNQAVAVVLASAAAENAHLARLLHKLRTRAVVRRPRQAPAAAAVAQPAAAAVAAGDPYARPAAAAAMGGGAAPPPALKSGLNPNFRAAAAGMTPAAAAPSPGASAAAGIWAAAAAASTANAAPARPPGGGGGFDRAVDTPATPPTPVAAAPTSAATAMMRAKLAAAAAPPTPIPAAAGPGNPFGGAAPGGGARGGQLRAPQQQPPPGGNPF